MGLLLKSAKDLYEFHGRKPLKIRAGHWPEDWWYQLLSICPIKPHETIGYTMHGDVIGYMSKEPLFEKFQGPDNNSTGPGN